MNSDIKNDDYLKLRRPFIISCVCIVLLALVQYFWNSNAPSTPLIIKKYSKSLAFSLIKNLPSRYLLSGRLSNFARAGDYYQSWKKHYRPVLRSISNKYQIDYRLVEILISVESGFRIDAISPKGAVGLMQVMPTTALEMGIINPFDPVENMHAGCKYLKSLIKRYNGNIAFALAAYNAGPGAVEKFGGIPPYKETQIYVRKILTQYHGMKNA